MYRNAPRTDNPRIVRFYSSVSSSLRAALVATVTLAVYASIALIGTICAELTTGLLAGALVSAVAALGMYQVASRRRVVASIDTTADRLVVEPGAPIGESLSIPGDALISATEWQLVVGGMLINTFVRIELASETNVQGHVTDVALGGNSADAATLLVMVRRRAQNGPGGAWLLSVGLDASLGGHPGGGVGP